MKATERYGVMRLLALGPALALAIGTGACGTESGGGQAVTGEAVVIDRTTQPLGVGTLLWADGTYGDDCIERSGAWSLRISGAAAMTNPVLSVITNNTACVLTLTDLKADQTYVATPEIDLTNAYQGSPSEFAPSGAVRFYGNAKLSSATFAAAFTMTFLYSDDPRAATGSVQASHSSVAATSASTSVTAPDYTMDLVAGALAVQTDVDYIVTGVSGTADLTDGSITGEGYVVDLATLPATPTFAELDAAYTAGTPVAIGGANPSIAASAFGLTAVDLTSPVVRTLIIRRVTSGVRAYQTFKITFSHP
jgi:hypothetical protein